VLLGTNIAEVVDIRARKISACNFPLPCRNTHSSSGSFYIGAEEIYMNHLAVNFIAGAAVALSASVFAVDTHRSQQLEPNQAQEPTQQEQVPAQNGTTEVPPPAPGVDAAAVNPEYAAALKKCESMTGARKAACADGVRTKFGQM
jgi:hypothetical protein